MKNKSLVFIGIIFLLTGSLTAKEPLKDYSFIRGVCHNLTPDQETLERDLGFMPVSYTHLKLPTYYPL
mgnify:CR=1 FL=1